MAEIREISEAEFAEAIKQGTVLVDFYAPWCNPCRMFGALLEQIASAAPENLLIAKVNVDENPALAAKFAIATVPTLMLYRDGKPLLREPGPVSRQRLLELFGE